MATTAEVKVFIKGKALKNFISLSVRQEILTQHVFDITCQPGAFDNILSFGELFVIEKVKDFIGDKIKIEVTPVGKDSAKQKSTVIFSGIILEVEGTKYMDAISGVIVLRGASLDVLMDSNRQCRSFENMTLDDIVNKVSQGYTANLFDKLKISSRYKESLDYVVQYEESDFDFLARLAKTYGEWMLVSSENHFYFGDPPEKKTSLMHGRDLHEFSFSMRLSNTGLTFTDYNYFEEKSIQKNSKILQPQVTGYLKKALAVSEELFSKVDDLFHNIPLSKSNADKELETAVKTAKHSRIAGLNISRGSSENCELSLGGIIKVESFSKVGKSVKTINYGDYRIISVTHSCSETGNYENNYEAIPLSVGMPPHTNPGLYPVCETQSAVVTDTNDPEGLGRVRVRFYWQDKKGESSWIRVITPYAGNNKGIFFIPEINEEVLIGFENQNAEKPYVIGALYNGIKKPDDWVSNKNYKKAIRTSSGHTIEFNDEGGKEEIIIYDKDKINTITLSSNGKLMTISCQGDLKIEAENINITANKDYTLDVKGKIKISSGQDTEVASSANCKITANQNVDIEASSSLTAKANASAEISGATVAAKGSGSAELSAGGQTVVKGGIVKIN